MRIRIQLDDVNPPVGTASRARTALPFSGWLDLLNAIQLLLEGRLADAPEESRPNHGKVSKK
jgi:hypothetical protein